MNIPLTPTFIGPLGANPQPNTQLDPHPQLSPKVILPQCQQMGPAIPHGSNPTLASESSVPRVLAPKPRIGDTCGIPEDSTCHSKRNHVFLNSAKDSEWINLHAHPSTPTNSVVHWTHTLSLTSP